MGKTSVMHVEFLGDASVLGRILQDIKSSYGEVYNGDDGVTELDVEPQPERVQRLDPVTVYKVCRSMITLLEAHNLLGDNCADDVRRNVARADELYAKGDHQQAAAVILAEMEGGLEGYEPL